MSDEPTQAVHKLIAVNDEFDDLIAALDRAARKGYMPDAMADEWEQFEYREVSPPAPRVVEPLTREERIAAIKATRLGDNVSIAVERACAAKWGLELKEIP